MYRYVSAVIMLRSIQLVKGETAFHWPCDHERWTRVGFVQLEFSTSWLKMAAVDDNQGAYLATNRSFFSILIGFDNILSYSNKTTKTKSVSLYSKYYPNININNDDVMMTILTISEKCSFHQQVMSSWLPSRDYEFTRRVECSISRPLKQISEISYYSKVRVLRWAFCCYSIWQLAAHHTTRVLIMNHCHQFSD